MIIPYCMLHDHFNVDVSQFFVLPTSVTISRYLKLTPDVWQDLNILPVE